MNIPNTDFDDVSMMIHQAHESGAKLKAKTSMPCSICKENYMFQLSMGIDADDIVLKREHFHGSDFGSCKRKVYLNMKNGKPSSSSNYAFLSDGHLHEESVLKNVSLGLNEQWLIKAFANDYELISPINDNDMVIHPDGMLTHTSSLTNYLIECKSVKDHSFKLVTKMKQIPDEWYGQIQSYMYLLELKSSYLIVKERGASKVNIDSIIKIDKDSNYITDRLIQLKDINKHLIDDSLPMIDKEHTSKKDRECAYCPYKELCF